MATTVTEYLNQLQTLTQTNLELLQALNDSFYTKREHLTVSVDTGTYTIPSFIYLENKVNALQESFSNLVNAPKTGEAYFNYDGNSQAIELKSFTCTPEGVTLAVPSRFDSEQNDIFKDFLTPNPYVCFSLAEIPDDISAVNVKKIIAISDGMKSVFNSLAGSTISYADMYKKQAAYTEDVDYVEYDTIRQLPIRKNIGQGTYVIKSIDEETINDDLVETYTLTISGDDPLKYTLFDGTIEKYLQTGDYLTTYDGSAKLLITNVSHNTSQLTLEVQNGSYVNFVEDTGDESLASDYSKLKFFSPVDFDSDKYINIPLEEDEYVAFFVAPLNTRMNIQSPWGTGVIVDTYNLIYDSDNKTTFKEYYNNNVNNIGDTLKELTAIVTNNVTKYTKEEFDVFSTYVPQLSAANFSVVQINKHLNNTETVKKIRSLYSQKQTYEADLSTIQSNIDVINETLNNIDFSDTTGIRAVYEDQLTKYSKQRSETNDALNNIMREIANAANNSTIPIENAKYHIRGFFDPESIDIQDLNGNYYKDSIKRIKVFYRYKSQDKEEGNATSINNFIYSDWNLMESHDRNKLPECKSDNNYVFEYEVNNSNINEPSYNQIDIPISQGETVDIKMQIIWDFGFPYIYTTSGWSDIMNIAFPDELAKDVQVLDIIDENNDDIEKNRFQKILDDNGITSHVGDKLTDQDITYFHQPEHIASGFYTDERRVIPLKDKLQNLTNDITELYDEVFGNIDNNLTVTVEVGDASTPIYTNQDNFVYIKGIANTTISGTVSLMNIKLSNESNHTVKLYPIMVGSRDTSIASSSRDEYKDYKINVQGVSGPQTYNQYIYFRNKDAWDSTDIDQYENIPYLKSLYDICVDSDSKFTYFEIKSDDSDVIPVYVSHEGLIQFDVKMSLYKDPVTYQINLKRDASSTDSTSSSGDSSYKPIGG